MKEEFYQNLKKNLDEHHSFPELYMFKFIVPADNHRLAQVEALFGSEAQVSINQSRSNKYISITAKEIMISGQSVIDIYKKAEQIDGIIAL